MATTKVGIAPMKVAQIPKAGADFEIVEREIPTPGAGQCGSRYRPAASATATCSLKKDCGRAFSIPAFQDTKSSASLMKWVLVFPSGHWASALASVGTAATTAHASRVGAEILAIAAR